MTETRRVLNEATAGFWSDVDLTAFLRQGALDLSMKTGCVEATSTVTLSDNTIAYAVPTSFDPVPNGEIRLVKIYAVLFGTKALVRVHPRMFEHSTALTTGDPLSHYALFGNVLYLFPGGSFAGQEVTVLSELVVAEPEDIPFGWQHPLINYAACRAKLKEEKYAQAAVFYDEYMSSLLYMRHDIVERPPSSRTEIMMPDQVAMVSQAT